MNEQFAFHLNFTKVGPKSPISHNPALVQVLARRWIGDKPLAERNSDPVHRRIYAELARDELKDKIKFTWYVLMKNLKRKWMNAATKHVTIYFHSNEKSSSSRKTLLLLLLTMEQWLTIYNIHHIIKILTKWLWDYLIHNPQLKCVIVSHLVCNRYSTLINTNKTAHCVW